MQRNRRFVGWSHVKAVAAAGVVAVLFSTAAPVGASQVILASSSPYCTTLLSFHPHAPQNSRDWKAYRVFAKSVLSTFEKLAAEAPNKGAKEVMSQLVLQLKFDSSTGSYNAFKAYSGTHLRHWEYDWQQFAASMLACVEKLS